MKLAIATDESNIQSYINEHFGRCKMFCLYDTDTQLFEFIENRSQNNTNNAGKEAAEMLITNKVSVAVAGRFGSKAAEILAANNIQLIIPANKSKIEDIITKTK